MEQIQTNQLRKHPRNYEFFDDISGERWKDFKESIMRRGVVEPIVVTQDLLVVSGHQRIRACEELGIKDIPCRITFYPEYDEKIKRTKEDMILEDLICTNIMQRGVGNVNPMKMARCIIELERIKGIQNGGDRGNQYKVADGNNFDVANQKELANELNISQRQLGNYKKLTKLIPELQQMIENNEVKATIGYKVYAKLSKEEQENFLNEIGKDKIKELTQKATKELIEEKRKLEQALVEEKNKPPKVVTEVVDKTDYESISKLKCTIQDKEKELIDIKSQKKILEDRLECLEHDTEEYERLKDEISNLIETKTSLGKQIQGVKKTTELLYDVDKLLKMIAPAKYSQAIFDLKDDVVVLENLHTMIDLVQQWCVEFRGLLPQKETKTIYMEAEVIE